MKATDGGSLLVIDIGKTLSKVSLWTRDGRLIDRTTRANRSVCEKGIARLDSAGIEEWLIPALAAYAGHPIEAIIPVSHGAGFAALVEGNLAFAPIDYEQAIPAEVAAAYAEERDEFAHTGSPRLPQGLNLGAQIFWCERLEAESMARAQLVTWPQYWGFFLTGKAATEITTLGCHSDLWAPGSARFSDLASRRGWDRQFAPLRRADEVLGTLRPELAAATGLPPTARILVGLHDSNAALEAVRGCPEIAGCDATVLSTGTWFVAMRLASNDQQPADLPEDRDCLVNVDRHARQVPSGRFMGGREIENLIEIDTRRVDIRPDQPRLLASVAGLVDQGVMVLPTLAPGFGPYPNGEAEWIGHPSDGYARRAAACLYAALVAETVLSLVGTTGRVLVEGRFAEAEVFVRALASLRSDLEIFVGTAHHDVSFGAIRLVHPELQPDLDLRRVSPLDDDLESYAACWRAHASQRLPETALSVPAPC